MEADEVGQEKVTRYRQPQARGERTPELTMAGTLRILRRRIRAVTQTKQITKAMELVATSRIAKAQQRVEAALPYTNELTRALSALASNSNTDHPLLVERANPRRAAILVITSDRGLAGAYSSNALRTANGLESLLREEGKEPVRYVIGRKGSAYYRFRSREVAREWTGFSEQPAFTDAREVGSTLVKAFLAGIDDTDDGEGDARATARAVGVDEIHIVYTEFKSMLSQNPTAKRIAPLVVEESEEEAPEGYLPRVRVRAGAGRAARRAAAEVHQRPDLRRAAGVGGLGVGVPAAGDEVRHRQRRGTDQDLHPRGQPGPAGGDHPGDQRDRRRRGRAGRGREREIMTAVEETTGTGRVVRVIGPVVDVEFGRDEMPELNNALHVDVELGEATR